MRSVGEIIRSEVDELLKWFCDWNASLLQAQQLDGRITGDRESALPTPRVWPEEREYRGRVAAAETNSDCMAIRNELRDKQKTLGRRKRSTLTRDQKKYWLLHSREYEGKSASEAAVDLQLQVRTVIDWRREYEHEKRPAARKAAPTPRDCEGCGETFTPRRSHARTCSDRCRKRLQRPTKIAA